jgi:hypothetical protein
MKNLSDLYIVITTIKDANIFFNVVPFTYFAVILAPMYEAIEPTTTIYVTRSGEIFIVYICGMNAENDGGHTAIAFTPAAILGS